MSVARHHAEWMSLVETSGPFLSMPILMRIFPQGLDPRETAKASKLRDAYEDWLDRGRKRPDVHHAWIRHVLTDLLEYPPEFLVEGQAIPPGMEAVMPNFGETLRPTFVLKHREADKKPVLLIAHYPPEQDLEKPVAGKTWKAAPGTRMMELLHAADVPLGLITNGEQWMLVYAPRGETTGFASWYADIWMQEPITLRAFHSLLHLRRFLGVAEPETLAAMYRDSSKDQQEVTDQLGYQVRQAVEMLVQAFDRIDAESDRTLLAGVPEKELYDSALTVMMRLVFLFSADERGLLLLGDPLYDQHYAVSTLSELLRERADQQGEEVLERRHDAWCRLLATFRAVHAGVQHEAMRLPAYGGTLFDPDRYPFLEGRAAGTRWHTTPSKPLPINNRVVLHLLEALQLLRVKVPGGGPAEARRVSFRALDIEQIGHVYEGLLDHTAKRATETCLGLDGSKKKEPEVALAKLEQIAAKGVDPLIEFLNEETGRSEKALKRLIEEPPMLDEHALLIACAQDPRLAKRVQPFAALLRKDSFERLVIIHQGSVYVTAGTDRRSSGTHYTPRSLTEPIVQHTLDPLVYIGPAEGTPQADWKLKAPREILSLKVCDMTCGSGAFLVQACRYLSERLVEAWELAEKANPGQILATPEGDFSAGDPAERLIPADSAERIAVARRYVADRCLYGVDINAMAIEMAKLSLWLITLQRDRPFTFLDHALKCGDSLLGVSTVEQIENFSLRPGDQQFTFATANLFRYVDAASAKRRVLEDLPSNDHSQIENKTRLHAEAEAATAKVKAIADVLIALELRGLDGKAYEEERAREAEKVQLLMTRDADASLKAQAPTSNELSSYAREQLRGRRPFHWPVEFPEVFARGGFDTFVGNPPFMGGQKITGTLGTDYRNYLVERVAGGQRGSADYCAYFFLQAYELLQTIGGTFGLVATNTIAQGDTREVGLDQIVSKRSGVVIRAVPSCPWPGNAALEVSYVWIYRGKWAGKRFMSDSTVQGITSYLAAPAALSGKPFRLNVNSSKSFIGSYVLGMGFVLTPEEARALLKQNPRNKDVVLPYINGEDLNSRPDQSPSRWIINFFDWPLERTRDNCWAKTSEEVRETWLRSGSVPNDYPDPVAADYPECLAIVGRLVKPERIRKKENGEFALRYPMPQKWWIYAEKRPALYRAIAGAKRLLAKALTSKHHAVSFLPNGFVYDQTIPIFALESSDWLAVLQSDIHALWALDYGASLETRPRYTPSDCFETFPFPRMTKELSVLGEKYHEQRKEMMLTRQEGLTKIYNRFSNPNEHADDVENLRHLHLQVNQAVCRAYGWDNIELGQGFRETKAGLRYTISEVAWHSIRDRLLDSNYRLHEAEIPTEAVSSPAKRKRRASKNGQVGEPDLFG